MYSIDISFSDLDKKDIIFFKQICMDDESAKDPIVQELLEAHFQKIYFSLVANLMEEKSNVQS